MRKYKGPLILLNLAVVFLLFNWAVFKKEQTLKDGRLILLELAPVDPRSLMQGDYMDLRYAISGDLNGDVSRAGYFVVRPDERNVAVRIRIQVGKTPLAPGETLIRYKASRYRNIYIGAESYFFEEGKGEKLTKAKFGGLKVDKEGNSILVGLYDEQCRLLQP